MKCPLVLYPRASLGGCSWRLSESPPSASRDFGLSLPGGCGDIWAFGGSSLAFLSPRNQNTCASALASFQNGNWMPVVSVLDECPSYSTAVGTGFLLLSLSPLSLHPFELHGCGEGCNSGLWIPSISRHLECAALLCEPGLPHWVQLASLISSWGPAECCLRVLGMWWYVVVSFLFQFKKNIILFYSSIFQSTSKTTFYISF